MTTRAAQSDAAYGALCAEATAVRDAVVATDGARASALLDKLRSRAAAAAETLVPYDSRRLRETLDALAVDVVALRRRPKFSFRARAARPAVTVPTAAATAARGSPTAAAADGAREHVSGRTDARVLLRGRSGAVRMSGLTRSVVIIEREVNGSVLIRECKQSVIVLSARQVRIHDCTDCTFLLTASSAPVMERSRALLFGPRSRSVEVNTSGYEEVKLGDETGSETIEEDGAYSRVIDFNHLQGPSPNWRVLESTERIELIDE